MFVRDSSAAAELSPLSAHSPKHGEKPACWTDAKSANGTTRTFRSCSAMSAFGGKADIEDAVQCPLMTPNGSRATAFAVPDDALERAAGGADGSAMTMAYTCLHGCTVWGNV